MLSKKLSFIIAVCSLSSLPVFESQGKPEYDTDQLAQSLQRDTGLLGTTVTDRSELTSKDDRVNADKIPATPMLHTVVRNMPLKEYSEAISVKARQNSFNNHGVAESIHPIVNAVIDMGRPLKPEELTQLRQTANLVISDEKAPNKITLLGGTRETVSKALSISSESHVLFATTHCTPQVINYSKIQPTHRAPKKKN
ncbi:MAG: hypothetical protein JSS34_07530 [Proteobacteria bacterium]|nr:hypothetical protein [Pseudomonadota bacterium]